MTQLLFSGKSASHLEAVTEGPRPYLVLASSQLPWSVHRAFGESPWRDGVNIWNCQPGASPDVPRVLVIHTQMEALGTGGVQPASCGGGCRPLSWTPVPQNNGFTATASIGSVTPCIPSFSPNHMLNFSSSNLSARQGAP